MSESAFPSRMGVVPATDVERRATVRYDCDLASACRPIAGDGELFWIGKIQDISSDGIGLLVCRGFDLGTILTVEIHRLDKTLSRKLKVRVACATQVEPPWDWLIGCEFVHPLSGYEVQTLL